MIANIPHCFTCNSYRDLMLLNGSEIPCLVYLNDRCMEYCLCICIECIQFLKLFCIFVDNFRENTSAFSQVSCEHEIHVMEKAKLFFSQRGKINLCFDFTIWSTVAKHEAISTIECMHKSVPCSVKVNSDGRTKRRKYDTQEEGLNTLSKISSCDLNYRQYPHELEVTQRQSDKRSVISLETFVYNNEYLWEKPSFKKNVYHLPASDTMIYSETMVEKLKLNNQIFFRPSSQDVNISRKCLYQLHPFINDVTYKSQTLHHTTNNPHSCTLCDKSFSTKDSLGIHVATHRDMIIPKYSKCNLKLSKKVKKMSRHSKFKLFTCEICSRDFSLKALLKQHLFTHSGEKPHTCAICRRSFALKRTLDLHERTHNKVKMFKCDRCKRSFTRKFTLDTHTNTCHKIFSCSICNMSFTLKRSLSTHCMIHSDDKPYKCDVCSESFSNITDLDIHSLCHKGKTPMSCTICKKLFIRKDDFNNHILRHSTKHPYSCIICNKSYAYDSSLKRHMQNHSIRKPYKCDLCGKLFTSNDKLQAHYSNHKKNFKRKMQAGKFTCTLCNAIFSYKSNLSRHMIIHGRKYLS